MIAQNTTNKPDKEVIVTLYEKQLPMITHVLKNSQHETFCQLVANDNISDAEAYRQAGYAHRGAGQNAHRLIKNDDIAGRIAYIRTERAVKAGITQEKQAIKLEHAQELALKNGDVSNYVRAVVEQSKHYGLSIDKSETTETVPEATVEQLEEFRRISQEILARKHLRVGNDLDSCSVGCSDSEEAAILGQEQG